MAPTSNVAFDVRLRGLFQRPSSQPGTEARCGRPVEHAQRVLYGKVCFFQSSPEGTSARDSVQITSKRQTQSWTKEKEKGWIVDK